MSRRPRLVLHHFLALFAVLLVLLAPTFSVAQGLPTGSPAALGLSPERLARLDTVMQEYVDARRIAGTVTLVARDGRVVFLKAHGYRDLESKAPMQTDTIFRIASMSKAVTSIAIMMLMEEGKLLLSDPVSKYIPAYKQTFVRVETPDGAGTGGRVGTVPAKRPITIRDLLTHTAGISYGEGALEAEYKAAGFNRWYFADQDQPICAAMERLASLPFEAQPGERFVYGYNTDILGCVVEKISGVTLDVFFNERIFRPLKMVDTSFFLPPERADRLATVYSVSPDGTLVRADDPRFGQGHYVTGPRKAFSGGAGLLSTASDYARLLQMLLNKGTLDGVRILSPASVELMTVNHVGKLFSEGRLGFGLGFEVVEDPGRVGRLTTVGEFGWGGAYFTDYFVNPSEGIVAVMMSQLLPSGGLDLQDKFKTLVYQAIEGPASGRSSRPVRTSGSPGGGATGQ